MNNQLYLERLNMVLLFLNEIKLAYSDGFHYAGTPYFQHMVWHAFQPILKGNDPHEWANRIEFELIPFMLSHEDEDGRWLRLSQELVYSIRLLRQMDSLPRLWCDRCS